MKKIILIGKKEEPLSLQVIGNKWTKTTRTKHVRLPNIRISETDTDYWMFWNLKSLFQYFTITNNCIHELPRKRAETIVPGESRTDGSSQSPPKTQLPPICWGRVPGAATEEWMLLRRERGNSLNHRQTGDWMRGETACKLCLALNIRF